MSSRIHLVVDEREHEAFRSRASSEGLTLSEWLRVAARERLERAKPTIIASVEDLDRFFDACREAESGVEPDWEQHQAVMERSRRSGIEAT